VRLRVIHDLDDVPPARWNALAGAGNPFVRHEFLAALERQGCTGERTGWWPAHLLAEGEGGGRGGAPRLLGAVPMYLKTNSFGEFVFDWGWADAYARAGMEYYPKLVIAVPFTPVTGPRLLVAPGAGAARVRECLRDGAIRFALDRELSSVHWLFTPAEDAAFLDSRPLLRRAGIQFHWTNPGYRDFGDFLDALTSKRRRQIVRERRDAARAGLDISLLPGTAIGEGEWSAFHRFYCDTFDRKWGMPSLTLGFFREIGRTLGDDVLLALARDGRRPVAGALFLRGADGLFGRHWGCVEHHRALHFEMCYYAAIEYCIRERLPRFEAGAQGEHKLLRGLLPVRTWSAHWIRHPGFRAAIERFVGEERRHVDLQLAALAEHSPFKAAARAGRPAPAPDVAGGAAR